MRQRLRSHLTYANVMVTIVAFLVLGGGTAVAAYVVSSNSQIGPGTVSGHHPPTGKHANIIGGSVNGQDVQNLVFFGLNPALGWVGNCFSAGNPQVAKSVEGVVYLRGVVCQTSGNSNHILTLPSAFRPTKTEYVPVDQFDGATGRIIIHTNGEVTVASDPQNGFAAGDFTSLAGASYTLPY